MPRPPGLRSARTLILTAQELADFRRAVKQMLNDKRGFDYFAGWHGAAPLVPALPW
jgi:hypothetical protein